MQVLLRPTTHCHQRHQLHTISKIESALLCHLRKTFDFAERRNIEKGINYHDCSFTWN